MRLFFTIAILFLSSQLFSQKLDLSDKLHGRLGRQAIFYDQNYNPNFPYFKLVYKNGSPYGKNAIVTYDDFYKKYKISFTKEDGSLTGCSLTDDNFIYTDCWKFKYNGNVYRLTNGY